MPRYSTMLYPSMVKVVVTGRLMSDFLLFCAGFSWGSRPRLLNDTASVLRTFGAMDDMDDMGAMDPMGTMGGPALTSLMRL
jgi:hypothetical protein